jgi:hypothetical protein
MEGANDPIGLVRHLALRDSDRSGDSGQNKNSIPPALTGSSRSYVGMGGPTIWTG